ncbi:hypothetical protein C1645_827373 [Glomus cerebriforme]|uniref:Uncharacterized protein n=1 Tax=Glomus cerebriforme TaxID=658196 RepID=A0A397SPV7_9GLOM|nr:hypothetical protein C1645_827373 [Glomus cerebriforme]
MHDYKKFLLDYKKLLDGNKNMMIIRVLVLNLEESGSENVDLHKKKNAIPKMSNFSEIIQQKDHIRNTVDNIQMPNLPIFTQSSSVKEKSKTPSTPTNLNSNPMPFFFVVLSLDKFVIKLDESGDTGEFANFKKIFKDKRISVNQIYDFTDVEFN